MVSLTVSGALLVSVSDVMRIWSSGFVYDANASASSDGVTRTETWPSNPATLASSVDEENRRKSPPLPVVSLASIDPKLALPIQTVPNDASTRPGSGAGDCARAGAADNNANTTAKSPTKTTRVTCARP